VPHACFKLAKYARENRSIPLHAGIHRIFVHFEDRINFSSCCSWITAVAKITCCKDSIAGSPQSKEAGSNESTMRAEKQVAR